MKARDLKLRRFRTWPLLVLLSAVLPGPVWAASDAAGSRTETINVTADRPLYSFSLELQKRHPLAVTYEETGELPGAAKGPRPVPGSLAVSYPVSAVTGMPENMAAVLQEAIAGHEAAGSRVRFKVTEDHGVYHIVPSAMRNARGKWVRIVPLLDTPVALPEGERPVDEVLLAIRDALQQDTGAKVILGEVPVNWVSRTKVRLGGGTESARELLDEALAGGQLTWQLLYDAKLKGYVLRIQPLAAP